MEKMARDYMKKLLITIFIFSLNIVSLSANDLRDFQIEGISIGDKLLDFISREEILYKKNSYSDKGYIYRLKDFYSLTFLKDEFPGIKKFDDIQFHLKDNDNTFKIYSISGGKYYKSMKNCHLELKDAETELNALFKDQEKRSGEIRHSSNKGNVKKTEYYFKDGFIRVGCQDWDESTKIRDALVFDISTQELNKFFKRNYKVN